ncbi:MAG: thioredoxin domain-containing protein [Bryobacterales bacterium]|nr:thioredoxin domain-containing protein [Bryobacterales bacterium]
MRARGLNYYTALLLVCAAVSRAETPAAQPPEPSREFESKVREYLLRHPEVVMEAIENFQAARKAGQERATRAAIDSQRASLLHSLTSPAAGPADDTATVVAFFDYRCGYCKRVSPSLVKLASGGAARVIFKELPILGAESVALARASLAAHRQGMDRYLKFHEALMGSRQPVLAEAVESLAAAAGLDLAQWRIDKESPELTAEIERNGRLAAALGVEATPTFIIGNEKIAGALDEATLTRLVSKPRAQHTAQAGAR